MILQNINELDANWVLTETLPNAYQSPSDLNTQAKNTVSALVPGTVAQAYADAGKWSVNDNYDFDAKDWWYEGTFKFSAAELSPILNFISLATLCDVWLNDKHILSSQNMFVSHQINVSEYLQDENKLVLCFRSLKNHLAERRSRPQWKTKLIEQQQLRWVRTTLLGRIPGWTPPVAPVGPYQPVFFAKNNLPTDLQLIPTVKDDTGHVDFSCHIYHKQESTIEASLEVNSIKSSLTITKIKNGHRISGKININNVIQWWPHTHGQAHLYTPELSISINNETKCYRLPDIGFKTIQIEQNNGHFNFIVNGQSIFCRGACWTINDIVSLVGNKHELEQALTLMQDAGANMIRIGGTMIYEQDYFYQLCDRLGIMVWQDFMFANMDYPINDTQFADSVDTEIRQTITRLKQHVCISLYCGNSEVEQQATMLGLSAEESKNTLFTEKIPTLCADIHPDIPYITSTPTGDILPFHTNKNVTHYYGVGAYRRPVTELRQHDVKFTPECLGFSNVPITKTRNQVLNGQLPVTHHPKWKERVPRDTGTGWDFEDVRDHYTNSLFNVDTTQLRCFDTEQYLKLSEVATGEIMSQVFSEWRSAHSQCSGGLVWFLKDFWPGAGWGIIDSSGQPKACYYYLKRCWQSINIAITNETLNGIDIHVNNETTQEFKGKLEISLLNKSSVTIASHSSNIELQANKTKTFNSDALLENFYDTTYSYRFGPAKHSVLVAQLKTDNDQVVGESFYFPNAETPHTDTHSVFNANAKQMDETTYELELSCNHFMYAVNIEVDGYTPSDNFFHLLPNTSKQIILKKTNLNTKRFKGYVGAINLDEDVKINLSNQ